MSGFEDELAEIIRKQQTNGEPTLDAQAIDHVLEVLKDKDTFGYLVYVNTTNGHQRVGLVGLGKTGYSEEKMALAHRRADMLIDELFGGSFEGGQE